MSQVNILGNNAQWKEFMTVQTCELTNEKLIKKRGTKTMLFCQRNDILTATEMLIGPIVSHIRTLERCHRMHMIQQKETVFSSQTCFKPSAAENYFAT